MSRDRSRTLTFRYVGALLAIAGVLVAGQLLVQRALDRQEDDARVVNLAGRQRMLSQRLCMLLLAPDDRHAEVARVVDEWQASHDALLRGRPETGGNSSDVRALFDAIEGDRVALLDAAKTAAIGDRAAAAQRALAHQDAFLVGMDRIVKAYEQEARDRVVGLRHVELLLLAIALLVLAAEGLFVFRPAVRALREHLAERDRAERQLVQVSDREQRRIAQDLHDGISQHLVGVSYLVKAAQNQPAGAAPQLAEIERLLGEAIDLTRSLARGLYSRTLELDGIAAALRELAAQTERIYDVDCRVIVADDAIANADIGLHLFSIAREAIANAAKHARAEHIVVELARQDARLVLTVRDDGVGLPAAPSEGMGLHMMQHRARLIGATLRIGVEAPRGTVVSCMLDHQSS